MFYSDPLNSGENFLFTATYSFDSIEFSLNVFTEFAEFSHKNYYILKRLFEPATSCVRDQDATTVQTRHM